MEDAELLEASPLARRQEAHLLQRRDDLREEQLPEELLSHIYTVTGEAPRDLIRAELVYFVTALGGAVCSVGSITFCGSTPPA